MFACERPSSSAFLRLTQKHVLQPEYGTLLGNTVRMIQLSVDDEPFLRIREADSAYRARGDVLFTSCNIKRATAPRNSTKLRY